MKTEIWGMTSVVDHQNQIVYLKCSSAITAMGIPAIVKEHYPGYTGKLVSMEHLENLRDQFIN
jgi:hypothetical protein